GLERMQGCLSLVGAAVPALGLGLAAQVLEHGSVRTEQLGAPRERLLGVELGNLEFEEGLLRQTEIEPGARYCDRKMHALLSVELCKIGLLGGLNRLFGAPQTALAVHHQSDVSIQAAQAAVGAKLTQR